MSNSDDITQIAQRERRHLLDVAFRMLGDLAQAEDIVQEALFRLSRAELDTIDDPAGWLVVVVGRLCLDHLRSARVRRESSIDGDSLADAFATLDASADPADRITLDDSVRFALLVVLERLTPAERTAFVLHDVFQLSFDTIASIVGRTPTACRQLASRARRRLGDASDPVRSHVESAQHRAVVERFIAACTGGDLGALMQVLAPDALGDATPGGVISGGARPARGARDVARRILQYGGPGSGTTLVSIFINNQPAVSLVRDGHTIVVVLLTIRDNLIEHLHAVGDPVGLGQEND